MKDSLKLLDKRLIEKYGERAFMYTEYPNMRFWKKMGDMEYRWALAEVFIKNPKVPLMLYIHIPHCHTQCDFCTCHTVITLDYSVVKKYLDFLLREIDMLNQFFAALAIAPNIREIHLGGGSPTYLKTEDFDLLVEKLGLVADIKNLDEFAIEIDPRRVKQEKVKYYHKKGINRISFGIQDFDVNVQRAVNRVQPAGLTERLLTPEIRSLFPNGINFDIICGLPRQSKETIRKTMEQVIAMSPDRICFNYLHFSPEFSPHQSRMVPYDMPNNLERKELFAEALLVLSKTDYIRTGYDHFVKSTDAVAVAMKERKMQWNRLGVTAGRYADTLAIGVHGVSNFGAFYAQNFYENYCYEAAIGEGKFPIFRGHCLSDNDLERRQIIHSLRNYFEVCFLDISDPFYRDTEWPRMFSSEYEKLCEFQKDGIVELDGDYIRITEIGQQFADKVCEVFDTYKTRA